MSIKSGINANILTNSDVSAWQSMHECTCKCASISRYLFVACTNCDKMAPYTDLAMHHIHAQNLASLHSIAPYKVERVYKVRREIEAVLSWLDVPIENDTVLFLMPPSFNFYSWSSWNQPRFRNIMTLQVHSLFNALCIVLLYYESYLGHNNYCILACAHNITCLSEHWHLEVEHASGYRDRFMQNHTSYCFNVRE